jgi:hypothetical protein
MIEFLGYQEPQAAAGRLRVYGDTTLVNLIQQYHEIPEVQARTVLLGLIRACLRTWLGPAMVPADRVVTHGQDFWLPGLDRTLQLWVRYTEPFYDVIARLGQPYPGGSALVLPLEAE